MSGGYEIILWALLLIASVTDLIWGKIYNKVVFPFLVGGILLRLLTFGTKSACEGLIAVTVAFILFYPLWRLSAFAAGDVKLLMAVGAWSDFKTVIQLGAFAILIGALAGLFVLIRQEGLKGGLKSVFSHLKVFSVNKSHRMPFGPAFLCGFFLLKIAEMKNWSIL